mgnify:CR=1 FL=1
MFEKKGFDVIGIDANEKCVKFINEKLKNIPDLQGQQTAMKIELPGIHKKYEELVSQVDQEFNKVRDIFIDRMQCRMGCNSCCSQLFSISASLGPT